MKIVGNEVRLSGDEVATAIDAYLVARRICVDGARTITVSGHSYPEATGLLQGAKVYVDPSGRLVDNRTRRARR